MGRHCHKGYRHVSWSQSKQITRNRSKSHRTKSRNQCNDDAFIGVVNRMFGVCIAMELTLLLGPTSLRAVRKNEDSLA